MMHNLDGLRQVRNPERKVTSAFQLRAASLFAFCWVIVCAPILAHDAPEIVPGPTTIQLGDKLATLKLPEEDIFIKPEAAKALLKKQGSNPEGVLGIVAAKAKEEPWIVICRFEDCGYVNDDDAGKLNADEILNSYKDGTKEQNEERKDNGIPPIFVGGWAEKPFYQKDKHQVIWAIQVKDEEGDSAPVTGVNYNTRVLGRRGVLSMNLVTDPERLTTDKPNVKALLDDTNFVKGQSYTDYQPGKDKSAGYGIAGLILGGGALAAAAKFGVFGALWKFILPVVLVCKKFIVVIVVAIGALLSKFFKKKDPAQPS